MAHKTNSFQRFWKELKRRKVIHVITVYSATAFVILELVNMVARPLQLPDWTEAFVIVLLCIGFIIAVFVSWIYDITPAGVKKTKPVSELKHIDHTTHEVSSGWKIATYVSGVIIIALVALNFISKRNLNADILKLPKSIAVLPFLNESPVDSNKYFINGIMEEVLTNLQKIKDFRVLSRTSTEQYKGQDRPTIPEIAKELNVNYVVEGSGEKYGNMFRLRVQLIKAKGKENHLWAKSYEEEIKETKDIFRVQSQIAQSIAEELRATITPEEKQLIEKIPTGNITAYDLYWKANEFRNEYNETRDLSTYHTSVNLYKDALEIDSTFAKAYIGLAIAYSNRYYWPDYFKENFLDSCLILLNKALSIDNQLDEAYYYKALYHFAIGQIEEALDNCEKAIKVNPNYYSAYLLKGRILAILKNDYVHGLENAYKALNLIQGVERPASLRNIGLGYMFVGFPDKAKYYFKEALLLDRDSVSYYNNLYQIEVSLGNREEALTLKRKAIKIGSTFNADDLVQLSISGRDQEAFLLAEKCIEEFKKSGALPLYHSHRIGYAFWRVGRYKEAEYYFKQQIKYCTESIKLNRYISSSKEAHYNLASVYAFYGEKKEAYQYLDEFNTMNFYPLWWVSLIKHDPLFDSIRNEERFQKILQNVEAKYQAEHERVRKWLEEQGML
jgi:TolB-like protein/Tfp pilus assembly protein PilF